MGLGGRVVDKIWEGLKSPEKRILGVKSTRACEEETACAIGFHNTREEGLDVYGMLDEGIQS